jgi:hypothetical protein
MAERLGAALLDLDTRDSGFNKGIRKAEGEANRLGGTLDQVSSKAGALGPAMARGAGAANDNIRLTSLQLANMQYQLQDIAVGLASGQSPFMVIAQQGSQIAQMFQAGTGIRGALRAIGTGLVSFLINPINLAVIGFAAAAAGASALFSTIASDGADANETVEDQLKRIKAVDEALASSIPALRDFIAEKDKLALRDDVAKSFETLREDELKPLRSELDQLTTMTWNMFPLMNNLGADLTALNQLQDAIKQGVDAAREGKDSQEDFAKAQEILADMINKTGNPALMKFQGILNIVAERARVTANAIRDLGKAQSGLGSNPAAAGIIQGLQQEYEALGKTAEQRRVDLELRKAGVSAGSEEGRQIASEVQAIFQRKAAIEQEEQARRKAQRAAVSAGNSAATEQQRVSELIDTLHMELAALRETDPVRQEMIRLRGRLAAATGDQRIEIEKLITTIKQEEEAKKASAETSNFLKGTLSELYGNLRSSRDAFDALGKTAVSALDKILNKMLDLAFEQDFLSGGGGGGIFGFLAGLFKGGGGGSNYGGAFKGMYATGGLIPNGSFGIVGDAGPEPVIGTSRGAMVLPNSTLRNMEDRGAGGQFNFQQNITPPDGFEARTREENTPGGKRQDVWFEEAVGSAIGKRGSAQSAVRNVGRLTRR